MSGRRIDTVENLEDSFQKILLAQARESGIKLECTDSVTMFHALLDAMIAGGM